MMDTWLRRIFRDETDLHKLTSELQRVVEEPCTRSRCLSGSKLTWADNANGC